MGTPPIAEDKAVDLSTVLEAERLEIEEVRRARKTPGRAFRSGSPRRPANAPTPPLPGREATDTDRPVWQRSGDGAHWRDTIKEAHRANFVGLALSGGGIRSASFGLGILQALAELGLLYRVDYLSTVSGGGYIGAWLAAWSYREGHERKADGETRRKDGPTAFGRTQMHLATSRLHHEEDNEPPPIRHLRIFSNYLTPKLGLFSGDTWAVVATVVRNLLLNQLIVLAALVAALLLPRALLEVGTTVASALAGRGLLLGGVFIATLMVALAGIASNMNDLDDQGAEKAGRSTEQRWILLFVAAPLLLDAIVGALWLPRCRPVGAARDVTLAAAAGIGAVAYATTWAAATTISSVLRRLRSDRRQAPKPPGRTGRVVSDTVAGVLAAAVSGALAAVLYSLLAEQAQGWSIGLSLTVGVPAVLGILLLAGILQMGLLGTAFADPKREWWARLGGWLGLWGGAWLAVFGIALYIRSLVDALRHLPPWAVEVLEKGLTPAWILTTIAGILAAIGGRTSGNPGELNWRDWLAKAAPFLFVSALVCALSLAIEWSLASPGRTAALVPYWALILGASAVALLISWRVDVNDFSLHALYRNRLVRCYLGASNAKRSPNLFTGFDIADDLPLALLTKEEGYDGPYPVLNSALNLVKGQDLAWQERKATSFVMTPLYCGYDVWLEEQDSPLIRRARPVTETEIRKWERSVAEPAASAGTAGVAAFPVLKLIRRLWRAWCRLDRFGYRRTASYASGLSLGAAMGISGAAANPNMGCHSSTPVAFLLTLFNVRLGQWLGNPRHAWTHVRATPTLGLTYLLNELFAGTNDDSRYVHLSDGGHFDNMGLYELVKRRCGLIVLCDAEADGSFGYPGLGNAIRKCRIDLGIDIAIDVSELTPKPGTRTSQKHYAVGTIHYEMADIDAPTGTLIYLKASLTGREPSDVEDYAKRHREFPHESTTHQWFSESQFESYRELGHHAASSSFRSAKEIAAVLRYFGFDTGRLRAVVADTV